MIGFSPAPSLDGSSTIPFQKSQRQVSQAVAARAERLERRHGLVGQLPGAAAAAVDAQKPGVRPFAQLGILADALAQLGLVALDVEQVVDDLERQSDGLAVTVERLDATSRGLRRSRPPCAAGRGAVPRSCGGGSPRAPQGSPASRPCRVPPWPARFALRPGGRPSGRPPCPTGPAASARIATHRSAAVPGLTSRATTSNASVNRPSPARIAVASSNALWQVDRPRRKSSSSIAGKIVVDQRIGVHHLQRTSRRQRRLAVAAARLGRHQAQDRPEPLAAPQHTVTHRHRQPRRTRRRRSPASTSGR